MTEEQIIDSLCAFLRERVAPQIRQKVANDKDVFDLRLAHPAVYAVYHPMADRGLPGDEKAQRTPALTVMPREGEDPETDLEPSTLGIRVVVTTWDPGTRTTDEKRVAHTRNENDAAWRAMCTLRELAKQEVRKSAYIEGLRVRGPFRTGMYAQRDAMPDFGAYCFGWLDFMVEHGARIAYEDDLRALVD